MWELQEVTGHLVYLVQVEALRTKPAQEGQAPRILKAGSHHGPKRHPSEASTRRSLTAWRHTYNQQRMRT